MLVYRTILSAALLALTACAASPNYVAGGRQLTPGEVPRNEYGQPVLDAMGTAPPPETLRPTLAPELMADIPPAKPLPTSPDRPLD